MRVAVPVFIDDKPEQVELIFRSDENNSIEICISVSGVEIPARGSIFDRLSIYESVAATLIQMPDQIEISSAWETFRPPTNTNGVIRFNPPAIPVKAKAAAGLKEELINIVNFMTVLPDPVV